jgi:acyl-CoA hydrolase
MWAWVNRPIRAARAPSRHLASAPRTTGRAAVRWYLAEVRLATWKTAIHMEPRQPAETVSVLTYRMGVQDANVAGNVHGGWIMKLCDDVAVIAATRHAGGRVVTAAVDQMTFRSPVRVGDVVTLLATVNAAWHTSMEVGVRVEAEDVRSGSRTHTCSAYLTMVALDDEERPRQIPHLTPATDDDRRRNDEAQLRREVRLAEPGELRRVPSD